MCIKTNIKYVTTVWLTCRLCALISLPITECVLYVDIMYARPTVI